MLEFKLQYYFELYKDTCIIKTPVFKDRFKTKHGDFELLNELIVMIQRYQIKKYGDLVESGKKTFRNVKKGAYNHREQTRTRNRFGTKEDRISRRINYERNL